MFQTFTAQSNSGAGPKPRSLSKELPGFVEQPKHWMCGGWKPKWKFFLKKCWICWRAGRLQPQLRRTYFFFHETVLDVVNLRFVFAFLTSVFMGRNNCLMFFGMRLAVVLSKTSIHLIWSNTFSVNKLKGTIAFDRFCKLLFYDVLYIVLYIMLMTCSVWFCMFLSIVLSVFVVTCFSPVFFHVVVPRTLSRKFLISRCSNTSRPPRDHDKFRLNRANTSLNNISN